MFDEAFFEEEFKRRTREYSVEHEGVGLRVEIVTREGERHDVLRMTTGDAGLRLETREERLVFVPYAQIAHADVSLLRDHRVASFEFSD